MSGDGSAPPESRLIVYPKSEVRARYDEFAPRYDRAEWLPEILGLRALRRRLFSRARGKVLEVAVGTGKNLPCYPAGLDITGIDLSPAMLRVAEQRANTLPFPVRLLEMDAERLNFERASFDTVTSSLTLCTFAEPHLVLREMARVCRPSGRILLLEHGRSDRGWLARWQDWRAEAHARPLGCQWNRDPLGLVQAAGLAVRTNERILFGVFHLIEATPA
jgi:ubiquinone/menaquinone biosynthesis C-methylase UbiE